MTVKHYKTKLSNSCTVEKYLELEKNRDRNSIAGVIGDRFNERYFVPALSNREFKHGFTIMAVSCLLIESLESYRRGWPNSRGKSELAFCSFFARWDQLAQFRPVSQEFYRHVRCGILHQAETTGGWRILRSGPLLEDRTINAHRFTRRLKLILDDYCDDLRNSDWDSEVWQALRKKMRATCENTKP